MKNISYYNNSVTSGYYDIIFERKKGVQCAWHHIKFFYIKEKIYKTSKHLDIGCGPGTFLGILKKKSIGIDVAQNQIKYANKKYSNKKIRFLTYKNKLPVKSKSIDSISMIELIEHIDNRDLNHLLKECKRVLNKNGNIYLSTPNYLSLWPILEFFLNKVSPVDYKHEHINKFNKKRLASVMKKKWLSNFRIKFIYIVFPVFGIYFF